MKTGFPPIADASATVLILGSMPSEESLLQHEYYAHPRNAFWKIMARLFEHDEHASYVDRSRNLKNHRIALWDVIRTCERPGSLDSAIDAATITENDFTSFYRSHPNIKRVFFNGAKAEQEYRKRVLPKLAAETNGIEYFRLPSTSPAMAQLSFDEKLFAWAIIKAGSTRGAFNRVPHKQAAPRKRDINQA